MMKSPAHTTSQFCLLAVMALVSSCATPPPIPPEDPNKPKPLFEWHEAAAGAAKGPVSVKIVIDQQKATIYRGGQEIAWTMVASGTTNHPTPTGSFTVKEKKVDKKSNLYGKIYDKDGKVVNNDAKMGEDEIPEGGRFDGSQMTYWMRITNDGVGMHIGPIPRPGHPASHGCVRLPRAFAKRIYDTVSVGTPVTIIQSEGPTEEDKAKQLAEQEAQKPRGIFGRRAKSNNS
jgi:hypothetical protein